MTNQHFETCCPARPHPEQSLSEAFREDPLLTMGCCADKAPSGDTQFDAIAKREVMRRELSALAQARPLEITLDDGTDTLVMVTSPKPLVSLAGAIASMDQRTEPLDVVSAIKRFLPEDAAIATQPIFTRP